MEGEKASQLAEKGTLGIRKEKVKNSVETESWSQWEL